MLKIDCNKPLILVMCLVLFADLANAIRPPAAAQTELMNDFTLSLVLRSEVRSSEISILDIGTGDGRFLPRIRDFFKRLGYEQVHVIGIDNGDVLDAVGRRRPEREKRQWIEDTNDLLHDKYGAGFTMIYMDFLDAPDMLKKFDFVFVNAPFPKRDFQYFKAAMELVKDGGLVFWRYYAMDDDDEKADLIKKFVEAKGWRWMELTKELPEGTLKLAQRTIVIRKTDFSNSDEVIRTAFMKLVEHLNTRSEIRKAA